MKLVRAVWGRNLTVFWGKRGAWLFSEGSEGMCFECSELNHVLEHSLPLPGRGFVNCFRYGITTVLNHRLHWLNLRSGVQGHGRIKCAVGLFLVISREQQVRVCWRYLLWNFFPFFRRLCSKDWCNTLQSFFFTFTFSWCLPISVLAAFWKWKTGSCHRIFLPAFFNFFLFKLYRKCFRFCVCSLFYGI